MMPQMMAFPSFPQPGAFPMVQPSLMSPAGLTQPGGVEQFQASPMLQMQMMMEELQMMMASLMANGGAAQGGMNLGMANPGFAPAQAVASPMSFPTRQQMMSASTGSAAPVGGVPAGTDFGKQLAQRAEATANRINTPGLCLKGVNDTLESMGVHIQRRPSAYMALEDLRKNDRFREVQVSKDKLDSLPAGAIVVWGKGNNLPHGHISVSLGDGREASSKVRKQLHLNTEFHVFMPK